MYVENQDKHTNIKFTRIFYLKKTTEDRSIS